MLGGVVAEPLVRATSTIGSGNPASLSESLRQLDLFCDVEGQARLAIVRATTDAQIESFRDPDLRARVADVARAHGFTHVAIDLACRDERERPGDCRR